MEYPLWTITESHKNTEQSEFSGEYLTTIGSPTGIGLTKACVVKYSDVSSALTKPVVTSIPLPLSPLWEYLQNTICWMQSSFFNSLLHLLSKEIPQMIMPAIMDPTITPGIARISFCLLVNFIKVKNLVANYFLSAPSCPLDHSGKNFG